MTSIDRPMLIELGYPRKGPCLSIFMPAESAGAAVHQDQVRLARLLKRGQDLLTARGLTKTEAEELTSPAARLIAEAGLWGRKGAGLAVFLAPGYFKGLRVPVRPDEAAVAGPRFVVRPLLPLLGQQARFYILALSRGSARFLRASGEDMEEVNVPGMPPSVEGATQLDNPRRHVSSHTSSSAPSSGGGQIFHGHGSAHDARDEAAAPFYRQVDAALVNYMKRGHAPIVLAAPAEAASDFRRIASVPLLPDGVGGSGQRSPGKALAAMAQIVVSRAHTQEETAALARFSEMAGRGRAAHHLEDVLKAAFAGRVQELFLASDAGAWGAFDPQTGQLMVKTSPDGQSDDLLDLAAALTLRSDGRVYPMPSARVHGDVATPAAATLRGVMPPPSGRGPG